jgi:hypothetical protein
MPSPIASAASRTLTPQLLPSSCKHIREKETLFIKEKPKINLNRIRRTKILLMWNPCGRHEFVTGLQNNRSPPKYLNKFFFKLQLLEKSHKIMQYTKKKILHTEFFTHDGKLSSIVYVLSLGKNINNNQ